MLNRLTLAALAVLLAFGLLIAFWATRSHDQGSPPLTAGLRTLTLGNSHSGAFSLSRSATATPAYTVSGYMRGYETLDWPTVAGAGGYGLLRDGVQVATAGPDATSTRFKLTAGTHTLSVVPRAALPPPPTTTSAAPPPPPPTTTAPTAVATGFWTTPIPASPAVDPGSAAMVSLLKSAATAQGFLVTAQKWSTPIYHVNGGTRLAVTITASWAPKRLFNGVPIPAGATPSPDGDAHLAVIDDSTGCEYDLWQAANANGAWSAGWVNATMVTGTGWFPWSATGSGDALTAGLITGHDMSSGITHALKFAYPYTKSGGPVLPAVSSDGSHTDSGAIPEGARLQEDPNVDLSTLGLNAWQTTVARGLQTYGAYLSDSGGGVAFPAVERQTYPWGTGDYAYLPTSIIDHLRVLKLGAQYTPSTPDPSAGVCGSFS